MGVGSEGVQAVTIGAKIKLKTAYDVPYVRRGGKRWGSEDVRRRDGNGGVGKVTMREGWGVWGLGW